MRTGEIRVSEVDCETRLLPILLGRVFHVTCARNVELIATSSGVLPNSDGRLSSSFGSSQRGFFRLRGCVSVFDFKTPTETAVRDTLWRCAPWDAGRRKCGFELAIYFLAPSACERLLPWTLNHEQNALSEMIVPYVEAGHPGAIPLSEIEELLLVSIDRAAPSPLELALEAIEARRRLT